MSKIGKIIASYGWNVEYDTFNINFNIPFYRQTNELNEDLLQASKDSYIIDIGFYPEGDPQGKIITVLISKNNFDQHYIKFEDTEDTNYLLFENHIKFILDHVKNEEIKP